MDFNPVTKQVKLTDSERRILGEAKAIVEHIGLLLPEDNSMNETLGTHAHDAGYALEHILSLVIVPKKRTPKSVDPQKTLDLSEPEPRIAK
mgnify:CR=1 FL=1